MRGRIWNPLASYRSDLLCFTNRALCDEPFLKRIEAIAAARPAGIVLREKDLAEDAYEELAAQVLSICQKYGTTCILHNYADAAARLNARALHLPLPVLRTLSAQDRARYRIIGASCHCLEDAEIAESLGCTYITAGHVFDTDCKKGLPGRGFAFLREICDSVSIPVYAIGGVSPDNIWGVRACGAAGACVMSGVMRCEDVSAYLEMF